MNAQERQREYSPSSCLVDGDYRPFVEAYRTRSDEAWEGLDREVATVTTVSYGTTGSQTIDVAVPTSVGAPPPLLVFIHGGYWQELSKADSRFAVGDCVANGWAFAVVDYTLAPQADVSSIVDECRQATRLLHDQSSSLGFDPSRIFIAGSSAGAHLAAMVALKSGGCGQFVAGTALVSGIFELEALIGTSINEQLGLTRDTAQDNSPLHHELRGFPPTVVAHGDNETNEFKAQSAAFLAALDAAGTTVQHVEIAGRNHFDVILDLAVSGTTLGSAVAALVSS